VKRKNAEINGGAGMTKGRKRRIDCSTSTNTGLDKRGKQKQAERRWQQSE